MSKIIKKHVGISLLEVLIAVLVVSIGALGFSYLHMRGLRVNDSSLLHSNAVALNYGMMDLIRYGRSEAIDPELFNIDWTCEPPASSASGVVNNIKSNWIREIKLQLGGSGCGRVRCVAAGDSLVRCAISVRWDDRRASSSADQDLRVVTLNSII